MLDWLFGKKPEVELEVFAKPELLSVREDIRAINEAAKVKQMPEDDEIRKHIEARDKAIEDFLERNHSFDFYGTTVFAAYHWYGQICGMYKLENGQIMPITIGTREAMRLVNGGKDVL